MKLAIVTFALLAIVSLLNAIGSIATYVLLVTFKINTPKVPLVQGFLDYPIGLVNDILSKEFEQVTPTIVRNVAEDVIAVIALLVIIILLVKRKRLAIWLAWLAMVLILISEMLRFASGVKEEVFIISKLLLILLAFLSLLRIGAEFTEASKIKFDKDPPEKSSSKYGNLPEDSLPQI